jgi:hypothetical protein
MMIKSTTHKTHMSSSANNKGSNGGLEIGETRPLLKSGSNGSYSPHQPNPEDTREAAERHRLERLCVALVLFSVACGLVATLALWKVHLAQEARTAQSASLRSADAMAKLNDRVYRHDLALTKGCESTLVMLRHCEKDGPNTADSQGNMHCSYVGLERSHYIASLFGPDVADRWPLPHHLFALAPDRIGHLNFREYETLHPLSRKAGVETELAHHPAFAAQYLDMLVSDDNYVCGKVSVLSWKHEYLPDLAVELGCGPDQGCPGSYDENDYDSVWLLKYVFHPSVSIDYDDENHTAKDDASENQEQVVDDDMHGQRRHLKKGENKQAGWHVYATVVKQNFDSLAFSKLSGDYQGSATSGGAWQQNDKRKRSRYGEL